MTASLAIDDLIASTSVAFRTLAMFFDTVSPHRKLPAVAARDLLDHSWTS